MVNTSSALMVFAKLPVIGQVKTRLMDVLSPAEAARLHDCFVLDALVACHATGMDVHLFVDGPEPDDSWLASGVVNVHRQKGSGLGERMMNAFMSMFRNGYQKLAVIGADHPTLPVKYIELAFEELGTPMTITIGPCDDGGYYLLGMNEFRPAVFEDMEYSHAGVFAETVDRAMETGCRISILPEWWDVDTPAKLRRLIGEFEAGYEGAPATRSFLNSLMERKPGLREF